MAYFNLPKRFVAGMAVDLQEGEAVIGAKVVLAPVHPNWGTF